MFATLIAAPMLLAQSATAQMVEQNYETREVAFEELLEGDARAAIAQLEAELEANPGDPAVLINLGSAHAQLGEFERAQAYYRQARDCEEGYELELANGRWLHSRDAATLALATVEFEALAAR
ncbi:tetratricopeptide repeat protein [Aurantiacibacter sp. D1-12]|uniref:tetratricopeptide repeat protein n=1 Tax=Aurantiacibacter sp. D1-12 TaxID=2993658 RepID=UPI00237CA780|nr:tetratricopeptide repeat protein [Aurantiacibacter sp. D1-12]MDE1467594.1 tetratricopeptide repeat protein [Aurantiacibacter sp. D1-12]